MRGLLIFMFFVAIGVSDSNVLGDWFPSLYVLLGEDELHAHVALEESPLNCASNMVMKDVGAASFWLEASDARLRKSLLIAASRAGKKIARDSSTLVEGWIRSSSEYSVKVELNVGNVTTVHGECVEARWITLLAFVVWSFAAVYVWWVNQVLPLIALGCAFVAPLVIQQGLIYVPLSSTSPATRFPLALLLIASHFFIPACLAAIVCLRTAPHVLSHAFEHQNLLSQTSFALAIGKS